MDARRGAVSSVTEERVPPSARRRVTVAFVAGVLAGIVTGLLGPWQLDVLVGFDVSAIVQLLWTAVLVLPLDAERTAAAARRADNSRTAASLAIIGSGLTSLVGVGLALAKARKVGSGEEVLITIVAVVTVVLAWLTVHTVFVLRYADLYYNADGGGIDFPGHGDPDYHDFAYVGFTVGMTYQVSDTNITSPDIRRTVIRHALISFLFGTVIIGLTINVMAGFIR